jgi:UDP-glucose 4-epimerase
MKNNKILITGCNGFIGTNIADYYVNSGSSVFGIDVPGSRSTNSKVKVYNYNLESEDLTEFYSEINPDIFIHCAGNANVSISVENPKLDFQRNVELLYKTLLELKKAKVNPTVIFLSSAAVYGNPKALPICEDTTLKPISPYALHKKMCEDLCIYFNEIERTKIKIIRIFSAYGEGLRKQILWDMYGKLNISGKIELFGTGNETRDFIHIDDIVSAIDLIAKDESGNNIYNIASGVEVTIRELAEEFALSFGYDKSVVSFNNQVKKGDPINWKADITKIQALGFRQKVSLKSGVDRYVKWVRRL